MKSFIRLTTRFLFGLMAAALTQAALAQAWPSRPIKMILPLAPGGGSDLAARVVAQALGDALGQPVLVDNRVGANGIVGVDAASKSAPDGYTILFGSSSTVAANKFLYKAATNDPFKEFVPLAMMGSIDGFGILVPADSSYKTVHDLVAAAKANPGQLNYGYGTSSALLCGEVFKTAANVNITKVPYRGTAQSLTDLAGGRIQMVCEPLGTSAALVKAGKLRTLGVTSKQRHALAPDVPTMAEAGVPMEYETWGGFFAPAGTPKEIVQRLSTELVRVQSRADTMAKIREVGFVPRPEGAEAFAAVHRAEYVRAEKLIKSAGITPE
ncbi:MAG: tripartite tricarboxylate transporter substrate binding protein [Burkholderiaceae bacterium]|nr:tripartite tricarboxylate transporter substrate binding protein [Burkholderiaceae bacterium]